MKSCAWNVENICCIAPKICLEWRQNFACGYCAAPDHNERMNDVVSARSSSRLGEGEILLIFTNTMREFLSKPSGNGMPLSPSCYGLLLDSLWVFWNPLTIYKWFIRNTGWVVSPYSYFPCRSTAAPQVQINSEGFARRDLILI